MTEHLRSQQRKVLAMNNIAFTESGTAYHPETGERIVWGTASDHKLVSKAQAEAYKEREEFKGRQSDFTFSAMDALHEVVSVLTKAQCGFLFLLQCYVSYETNTLVNVDRTPMTTKDMRKALGLEGSKRRTFYDFLRKVTGCGIIVENENGSYSMNERYHFRGVVPIGLSVVKSYSAKIQALYGKIRPEDLGLLYRMLPLVHYSTNTLCANPGETVPEKIYGLNRKELAAAIGVSVGEISRRLSKMIVDGEYVIAKVSVGGSDSYMLNPWIFYRKTKKPDDTLAAIFRIKPASK